jgi:acetyl-CoA carboxylase biotin carboxylase subunit
MGIKTVAVYSEADKNALHVKMADEAYCIGPARPDLSYLNVQNILSVAKAAGAEAIHPDTGFCPKILLLPIVVEKCGFVFIGPDSKAIERMGQKSVARILWTEPESR